MKKTFKERCLDVMERALACYTMQRLLDYVSDVEKNGLKEHGFSRLTANIGILNVYGRRKDLFPLFLRAMDICCEQIPKVKAANEFSIKELCFLIMELERNNFVETERLKGWKDALGKATPFELYTEVYTNAKPIYNWALFGALSEWMRIQIGISSEKGFVDEQIKTQLQLFDEYGMYREPGNPMMYDLVARYQLTLLLYFGYDGQYKEGIDALLKKAAIYTLKMQSVTGEIPYGGRSNQFLHNEAELIPLFEYEANRYFQRGEYELATEFRRASLRALESLEGWLTFAPNRHIKNKFPIDSGFGCEGYAYFNKYMITLASNLYPAILYCNENISEGEKDFDSERIAVFKTSEDFHKLFVNKNGYSIEYDYRADSHYDASGIGRVQRAGAPSAICLALPIAQSPEYGIGEIKNERGFSIAPVMKGVDGRWQYASDTKTEHTVCEENGYGYKTICQFPDGQRIRFSFEILEDGVYLCAETDTSETIGISLPLFYFDGEAYTKISTKKTETSVSYCGWICRYNAKEFFFCDESYANRNGVYTSCLAIGKSKVAVKINIEKE